MKPLVTVLLFFSALQLTAAQGRDYSKDAASVDAVITALYDVISGGPGVPRDWDRFRYLFKAEARLIPTRKSAQGELTLQPMTPEEYITLFTPRIPNGFFEREIHRTEEQFGTVTHVLSTYETRDKADGPVTNRGINSIQLFHDGKRFFVINIFWCAESIGFSLPEKYLPK